MKAALLPLLLALVTLQGLALAKPHYGWSQGYRASNHTEAAHHRESSTFKEDHSRWGPNRRHQVTTENYPAHDKPQWGEVVGKHLLTNKVPQGPDVPTHLFTNRTPYVPFNTTRAGAKGKNGLKNSNLMASESLIEVTPSTPSSHMHHRKYLSTHKLKNEERKRREKKNKEKQKNQKKKWGKGRGKKTSHRSRKH